MLTTDLLKLQKKLEERERILKGIGKDEATKASEEPIANGK